MDSTGSPDMFWSLFETTGSPAAYLLYKEMRDRAGEPTTN
jgi:hypothetical protein